MRWNTAGDGRTTLRLLVLNYPLLKANCSLLLPPQTWGCAVIHRSVESNRSSKVEITLHANLMCPSQTPSMWLADGMLNLNSIQLQLCSSRNWEWSTNERASWSSFPAPYEIRAPVASDLPYWASSTDNLAQCVYEGVSLQGDGHLKVYGLEGYASKQDSICLAVCGLH